MAVQTTGDNPQGSPMMDMNVVPLIDVLLVLLIMFIITIPIQTHAVKLDLPQDQPTSRRRRSSRPRTRS
jgi:biopolymer transport protein ExbD